MNSIESFEKIERYFEGQMIDEELLHFEKQMKEDQELLNKIQSYKIAVEEIKNQGRVDLKDRLQDIHLNYMGTLEKKKSVKYYFLRTAAVIAGISITTLFLFYFGMFQPKSTKDSLFSEYFKPYSNMNTYRGDNAENISLLQKTALYYYSKGQYDKAIPNFEELFKSVKNSDDDILFYYGITCLGVNQNQKAINIFAKFAGDPKNIFCEESTWYLALSYLKSNDLQKTRLTLKNVIKGKGSHLNQALDLLEKIN
jgi:tetratricopeptide (TPR) repeat protein